MRRLADLLGAEGAAVVCVAETLDTPAQRDAFTALNHLLAEANRAEMELLGDLLALLPPHTRRELGDVRLHRAGQP